MRLSWKTEQRLIKDLIPFEYNPRFITEERKQKLIKSLEKFNLVEIPAINLDNKLIAGHQRIKVMIELNRGDELIDVRVPDRLLTESEFKEYNITSNLPTGFWDVDILDQAFGDINLSALGLDANSIEIPGDLKPKKVEEESDFVLIEPRNPISEPGDIIELHSLDKKLVHRIICASSTDAMSYDSLFEGRKSQMIITDPPYNVDYTGGTKEALKIQNDSMSDDTFHQFLLDFYAKAFFWAEDGCPIYVFHADSEGANFRSALKKSGWKLAQCLIWVKNSMVLGRQDYQWMHEPILYGWKLGAAHHWYSDRSQKTVIEHDKPLRNDEHPTMKPVGLVEYFLHNSSKRYDIVFDGFMGSGTTLIACEKNKRIAYGMELDPIYMDVDLRRWHTYMKDNGLDFKIIRNGRELHEEEIQEYYQRAGQK
jgi:DNA modification methylase